MNDPGDPGWNRRWSDMAVIDTAVGSVKKQSAILRADHAGHAGEDQDQPRSWFEGKPRG